MSENWIWDQYWHSDRVASCFDGRGASNYSEAVAAGWRAFFRSLGDGVEIVDLCCGNGAVSIIAAETAAQVQRKFHIVAVDRADIDPLSHLSRFADALGAIVFRGGVDVEVLPFPDASFDVAISQYGIEYTNLDRSLPEMWRVLRPKGRVRLVLHAAEGQVADWSRPHLADADFLLEEIDLCGVASRCFEAVTEAERNPEASDDRRARARESLAAFTGALERAARYVPTAADPPMIRHSGRTLFEAYRDRGGYDLAGLKARVEDVRAGILAHRGRIAAMLDAAVTREEAKAIAAKLRDMGAEASVAELQSPDGMIGYVIEAAMPPLE